MKPKCFLKRLLAGGLCLMLTAFTPVPAYVPGVYAAGAEPLDWDSYFSNPEYSCSDSGLWRFVGDISIPDCYSRVGGEAPKGAETTEPGIRLKAVRRDTHELIASQILSPDMQAPQSYINYIDRAKNYFATIQYGPDKYNGDDIYSGNDVIAAHLYYHEIGGALHLSGEYYRHVLNEYEVYTNYNWAVELSFKAELFPSTEQSYEYLLENKGLNQGAYESRQQYPDDYQLTETQYAGRTAFIWDYDSGDYYQHDRDYFILDPLPQVPGCWLLITIFFKDFGPEDYKPDLNPSKAADDSAELREIISAHKDLRESLRNQVIPDIASMPITAAWADVDMTQEDGKIVQNKTTKAESNPGEDGGKDIDPDIVDGNEDTDPGIIEKVAVSVGGAAVAGAIVMGGHQTDSDTDERKKKRYRMYVYKGFGDAIQKGAAPVQVYARIVEIVDGKEENRPDLSEKITVSGTGLIARPGDMVNTYRCAEVSAAEDAGFEGTLTFSYAGEGGVFRRNIIFRLVGQPRIVFPDLTADGTGWDLSVCIDTVSLVAGLGGRERLRFVLVDAMDEPKSITFSGGKGLEIQPEKDGKAGFTYYAAITNNSPKAQKANGMFADPEEQEITIHAVFPNDEEVLGYFTVKLWPDGLSVPVDDGKDNVLVIDTRPNPNAGEFEGEIRPAVFSIWVCYVDNSGAAVILENPTLRFKKLDDKGKYGNLFQENFHTKLSRAGSSGFLLYPEETLPVLRDPYEAVLPISYQGEETFEGNIPVHLLGVTSSRPSGADWNKAYDKLRKAVLYFGIGNDPSLRALIRNAEHISAYDLDLVRYQVVEAGVIFYQQEYLAQMGYEKALTNAIVVMGALVKSGDMAVEYVLKYYFVGYGYIVAKFCNPLKNLLCTYIGEYIANGNLDRAPDFVETVLKSTEEALSAAITGVFWGDDLKGDMDVVVTFGKKFSKKFAKPPVTEQIQEVLGYVIAAYLFTSFTRHYYYGTGSEKGDIYRSVLAAVGDLGLASLKAWFLDYVSKYCVALFSKIGESCGKLYKAACQKKLNEVAEQAGWKAFQNSVRTSFQSKPDELTKAGLDAARKASKDASEKVVKTVNDSLDAATRNLRNSGRLFGEGTKRIGDSVTAGQLINYYLGGKDENGESYGSDAKDVVYELVKEWLGVKVRRVYEYTVPEDVRKETTSVDLRVENDMLVIIMLGCAVEVSILDNITAMTELMFETLFSWLDKLWEGMKTSLNYNTAPNLREKRPQDVEEIERDLKETKQRIENNQWKFRDDRKSF